MSVSAIKSRTPADDASSRLSLRLTEASDAGAPQGMPREALEAVIGRTPFAVWLGAQLEEYRPGHVSLSVPLRREITMHHGFAHGAVIGFLADSACAWAAASIAGDVVTSEYKLNLLAPSVGDLLLGIGDVIKVSGRQVVCRADVFSMQGEQRHIVATALATIAKFK